MSDKKDFNQLILVVIVAIVAIAAISLIVLQRQSAAVSDSFGYASSSIVANAKIDLGCYQNVGYNIYKKGFVTFAENNFSYTVYRDGCIDNKTLKEFSCQNGQVSSETVACDYMCLGGVCRNQTKK